MCGINGFIVPNPTAFSAIERIQKMNNDIVHRGPDDEGQFIQNNDLATIAIGMRRLSIIDLNAGHQPMFSADKKIAIVFNGEIYNYLELRSAMISKGHHFVTESDTEVILRLYEICGKECFQQFNGMFSICIYDSNLNKLILARDRMGEKPLYYTFQNGIFVFASELKSITSNFEVSKKIDAEALNQFLALTFIPAPLTIFENIFKLSASHILEFNISSFAYSICKYWDSKPEPLPIIKDYQDAKKQLHELVVDAVVRRTIADVPLGVFLSGGVDSSVVAAIMAKNTRKKIKTFSIGFSDPAFDESEAADMVAKHIGSEHTMVKIDANNLKENISEIILNYDEPFADSSALPTYQVSKMAREHVKVALTGDGGDEVFGGYNRYKINDYYSTFKKAVPLSVGRLLIKNIIEILPSQSENRKSKVYLAKKIISRFGNNPVENIANIISLGFQENDLQKLLLPKWRITNVANKLVESQLSHISDASNLHWMRYVDKNISLEGDMLVKVDRASMLTSLECRAPFLDHRLYEFTNKLPIDFLIKGNNKKRILKETFKDWLPDKLFMLPKSGFGVPVGKWLKEDLKKELIELLNVERLLNQGIFNPKMVAILLQNHLIGKQDNSFQLWTLFCFQKWFKQNLD